MRVSIDYKARISGRSASTKRLLKTGHSISHMWLQMMRIVLNSVLMVICVVILLR